MCTCSPLVRSSSGNSNCITAEPLSGQSKSFSWTPIYLGMTLFTFLNGRGHEELSCAYSITSLIKVQVPPWWPPAISPPRNWWSRNPAVHLCYYPASEKEKHLKFIYIFPRRPPTVHSFLRCHGKTLERAVPVTRDMTPISRRTSCDVFMGTNVDLSKFIRHGRCPHLPST